MVGSEFKSLPRLGRRGIGLTRAFSLIFLFSACSGSVTAPPHGDGAVGDLQGEGNDRGVKADGVGVDGVGVDGVGVDGVGADFFPWPDGALDMPGADVVVPDLPASTKCSGWPTGWKNTCYQKMMTGCEAICADAGIIRKMVCAADGTCTCQVGANKTTCAKVTPVTTFCGTCAASFAAGCCLP